MTSKTGHRNNYETLVHIEDVTNETVFKGQEIPYRISEFQRLFSGIPTDNLYWDAFYEGRYLVDNGNCLMFYLNQDDIYYPPNPVSATETYYRHLIMWERKEYDLLFPDVPEDFRIQWFEITIKNGMPVEMIYPIYQELIVTDDFPFEAEVKALIQQSKDMQ